MASSHSTPFTKVTPKSRPKSLSSPVIRKASSRTPSINDNSLINVEFEVRGKVQGVFFRKYTQTKGVSLGLRGWCQNTDRNSVIGCMEGPHIKIEQMKQWLKSTGSPKSIIAGAEFKDKTTESYTLSPGFQIIK